MYVHVVSIQRYSNGIRKEYIQHSKMRIQTHAFTNNNKSSSFLLLLSSSFQTVGCRIAVQYKEHGLLRDKVAAVVLQV